MEDYRVQLETYSGPLDLLLYLIRREEVDICDIPIARILEQYLHYVRMLETVDPEAVGDFLVMAATLMEIKSRMLLPRSPVEETDAADWLDPRADLVRQLLEYRQFREAAGQLGRRAEEHALRFGRPPAEIGDEGAVDLDNVQLWDLLAAFNKVMASVGAQRTVHEVKYDDTPITLHADDILDRLQGEGTSLPFERIFEGRTRSQMIGLFLALLELIRQRRVRVEQEERFGPILVHLLDPTPITVVDGPLPVPAEELDAGQGQAAHDPESPAGESWPESPAGGTAELPGRQTVPGTASPGPEEPAAAEAAPNPGDGEEVEEDDEVLRRIRAIRVGEVDLGGTKQPATGEEPLAEF